MDRIQPRLKGCRWKTYTDLTVRGSEDHVQVPVSIHVGHRDVVRAGRINVATDGERVTLEIPKPRDLFAKMARHHNVKEPVVIEVTEGKPP